jgi:hypothetical protein
MVAAAAAMLTAGVAAADAPLQSVDEARIRGTLADILARDEFRAPRQTSAGAALTRAWLDLSRWMVRQPPRVSRSILSICGLVLLLAGAHVAITLRAALRGAPARRGTAVPAHSARAPGELLAAAARAANRGDYSEGVRLLYLAALADLDADDIGERRPGLADWNLVRLRGSRAAPLAEVVRLFQKSRYGGRAVSAQEYAVCLRRVEAVTRAASASLEPV